MKIKLNVRKKYAQGCMREVEANIFWSLAEVFYGIACCVALLY